MTRKETTKRFKTWAQQAIGNNCSDEDVQMFENILALLEQEPCEDYVSRQEALKCFTWTNDKADVWYGIKNLPSITSKAVESCEDCISRKSVEALLEKYTVHRAGWYTFGYQMTKELKDLPSVIPKQKMCFDGMTNGDVIQTLFPKAEVYVQELRGFKSIVVWFEDAQVSHDFTWDWWNAPYKAEKEDTHANSN